MKNKIQALIVVIPLLFISLSGFAKDNFLSAEEKSQGWHLLFNGEDMSQWRNFKKPTIGKQWQVIDGEIRLTSAGGGDLLTKQTYQNFELMLEWKISEAGNSGIFILADELGEYIYSHAIEVQILDNERHSDNKVASHLSGSIYDMIASPATSHKSAGQWNQLYIVFNKMHLKVWQNEILAIDVKVRDAEWNKALQQSKFSSWPGFARSDVGHIGLQDHSDPVAFKNIKIKTL